MDRGQLYELFCTYGSASDPEEIERALLDFRGDGDIEDYQSRFNVWRVAGLSEDQISDQLFGPQKADQTGADSQTGA